MGTIAGQIDLPRELAEEQKKPIGLFAGVLKIFTKEYLQERVMALREKKLETSEGQQIAAEAETSKSFLLGLLDRWLFKEQALSAAATPEAPVQAKELVDIGMDKNSFRDNPEAASQRDSLLASLGELKSPHTPAVARSHSQNLGASQCMSMA